MKSIASIGLAVLSFSAFSSRLQALPIDVTYTVSGSSGDYQLDFSVTNNLNWGQDVYFFGVQLAARDIVSSPASFNPNSWTSWNNSGYGGSSTVYNNNWLDGGENSLGFGQTLSGFVVHVTDWVAPTSVSWFAYSVTLNGALYLGGDNFNSTWNPGFEGTSGGSSNVPDACSTLILLGAAFTGMGAMRRRS